MSSISEGRGSVVRLGFCYKVRPPRMVLMVGLKACPMPDLLGPADPHSSSRRFHQYVHLVDRMGLPTHIPPYLSNDPASRNPS